MKRAISLAFVLCLAAWLVPAAGSGAGSSPGGKAPTKVVLGELSKAYGPVSFDHAKHVGMASGCGDCHHQHGTEKSLSCKECHALDDAAFRRSVNAPVFRSCKGCHAPSRTEDLERPDLKVAYHRACFKCHRGDVGTVGTDPKGCVEMCHAKKDQTN